MNKKSFTITEILVVVVIISIIAAFAIPTYEDAIQKSYERDAVVQLRSLEGSAKAYQAKNGVFPISGPWYTPKYENWINSTFGVNVSNTAGGVGFTYDSVQLDEYRFRAGWQGANRGFKIDIGNVVNGPCCSDVPTFGQCLTVPDC